MIFILSVVRYKGDVKRRRRAGSLHYTVIEENKK